MTVHTSGFQLIPCRQFESRSYDHPPTLQARLFGALTAPKVRVQGLKAGYSDLVAEFISHKKWTLLVL